MLATLPTAADYAKAFELERSQVYPVIDQFEAECGFAIDRKKLEAAARVLACPVKNNAPCWQHGRVIYAAARRRLLESSANVYSSADGRSARVGVLLDIGSAKGFSALCLYWANADTDVAHCTVESVDVIDPSARESRNTVAECDGLQTLAETLAGWPEAKEIRFLRSTGIEWLTAHDYTRIQVAFIDGKHTGEVVAAEGALLSARQKAGDLAIFDDVQIDGVAKAVKGLSDRYDFQYLWPLPHRAYAVGVRR